MEEKPGSKGTKTRRPTSHDVARLAGVSQATVSLIFSGRAKEIGISHTTEDKVIAAARDLSYVPNKLMKSILHGRSGILGVYGPGQKWSMRQSYWAEVLTALHEGAAEEGLELLFFTSRGGGKLEEILNRILCGLVDGVIVQPGTENEALDRLIEARFPVVAVGDPYREVPSVTLDNDGGARLLVRHLYGLGHRRFAYLRVEDPSATASFPNLAAQIRPKAYSEEIACLGLDPERNPQIYMAWDVPTALDKALATGATALMVHNDEWAYKIVMEAESRGIRIPEDVAVTGFDGIPVHFARRLVTTIQSPISSMGLTAIQKLQEVVEARPIETVTTLPVEFVKGDTT